MRPRSSGAVAPRARRCITWYFRSTFEVANPAAVTALLADLIRDDGAVVYVNGVEVFRTNLPAGPLGFTTKASANLGGADERTPVSFSVPSSALVAGTNVIAVEVHNVGPTQQRRQLPAHGSPVVT